MSEHTNKQFETELENVRSDFLRMGGLVEDMVGSAMDALIKNDMYLVDRVREHEKIVNSLEVAIDERITNVLARHQPTAVDLRLLLSVSKMLTDMERSGDEAEKIAVTARRIHEGESRDRPIVDLRPMKDNVLVMLSKALNAFARHDPIQAAQVVRSDKAVDKEWKSTLCQLIIGMTADQRTISIAIDLIFIARALERIGDHAKNMAERVIYMVHGADVRHTGVKNTERLARGKETEFPMK